MFNRKNVTRKNRNNDRKNRDRMTMPVLGGGVTLKVGSKAQVYHGSAEKTAGGLKKADLVMNKRGHIVSRKQMAAGKKAYQRLAALGYAAKKGTFKLFTKKAKRS
jgi:hypothetical protein